MDKHHTQFDYDEENKLCYMDIFAEYRELIESFITDKIEAETNNSKEQIRQMESLITNSPHVSPLQDEGEVVELILSLSDFLVFKELMLDHKTSKTGRYDDLNVLQVSSMDGQGSK